MRGRKGPLTGHEKKGRSKGLREGFKNVKTSNSRKGEKRKIHQLGEMSGWEE